MSALVIPTLPAALVLYGAALFLCLFDRFYNSTRGAFTYISAVLALLASAYSIYMGAAVWECAAVLLGFTLLNMGVKE